jgi:hypothetical protein
MAFVWGKHDLNFFTYKIVLCQNLIVTFLAEWSKQAAIVCRRIYKRGGCRQWPKGHNIVGGHLSYWPSSLSHVVLVLCTPVAAAVRGHDARPVGSVFARQAGCGSPVRLRVSPGHYPIIGMAWRFVRAAWSPVAFLSSVDHSPSLCGIVRRPRNGWLSPQGQLRFIATSLAAERTMALMFLRIQFHFALAAPGAIVRAFYPHRGVRPCRCPSRPVDTASDTHRWRGEKRTGRESFTAETVHLFKGRTSLIRTYFVHLRGATFN